MSRTQVSGKKQKSRRKRSRKRSRKAGKVPAHHEKPKEKAKKKKKKKRERKERHTKEREGAQKDSRKGERAVCGEKRVRTKEREEGRKRAARQTEESTAKESEGDVALRFFGLLCAVFEALCAKAAISKLEEPLFSFRKSLHAHFHWKTSSMYYVVILFSPTLLFVVRMFEYDRTEMNVQAKGGSGTRN
nr:chromatin assembly factor 1 subunit A-like [Malus domestica]